jgi:lambda family phage portal protein
MNWFDRYVIAPIAPRTALKRASARRALRAYYEAGESSRYRKARTDKSSANTLNQRSAEKVRTLARHLDENHDIASGILDVLVANTVGTGIQPEPQVLLKNGEPASEFNTALLKLYEDWRFRPDVTWQFDYYGLQRIAARSYFRDGEVFANRVTGPVSGINHGTLVPYSIEALEADFVPYSVESSAPRIVQGVEMNEWGRPVAYHVYKRHPGESIGLSSILSFSADVKRVSADTMVHVAFRKRLHQVRGMSMFASIANRLDDIKEIDECERIAAKVAASMAAYIKKGQPEMYEDPAADPNQTDSGRRSMQFEPGLIFDDLEPGEEIGTIDTKRPNNALIPFRDSQLRSVASGCGASFSSISKNYNGTYSAQRQELVEHYMNYQMAAGPMIYAFCQPIWEGLVDAALASGKVTLVDAIDRDTLWDCTHTSPAMPWIDPQKEVDARVTALQWKLTSRSRVIRESGKSPDQINREIARDQKEAAKLGIDINGPKTTAPPGPPDKGDPNNEGPGRGLLFSGATQ